MKPAPENMMDQPAVAGRPAIESALVRPETEQGSQRLSLKKLQEWESWAYGMFLCYGMSTFGGTEHVVGRPATDYAPSALDVDQWVCVARDAGMKYVVLTTKHTAGHCLWPSKHTDFHVGNSTDKTDVVEALVKSCERRGLFPGLYYCSWDNYHRFGSVTFSDPGIVAGYTTRAYQDFQMAQMEELLTQYGPIPEVWIDIPIILPMAYRHDLYKQIAAWQPEAAIMYNSGQGDHRQYPAAKAWPSDLISMERAIPPSYGGGHQKWRKIEGKWYYMPAEVNDPIGAEWFYTDADQPRRDEELLGMYLLSRARGANFLLSVGPDRRGLIPDKYIQPLMRLRQNLDKLGIV